MFKIVILVLLLIWVYMILGRSKFFLHMMQVVGYEEDMYRNKLKKRDGIYSKELKKSLLYIFIMAIVFILGPILFNKGKLVIPFTWYIYNIFWIFYMFLTLNTEEVKLEDPLVFTKRGKRLYITNLVLNLLILLITIILYNNIIEQRLLYFPTILLIASILYYFQPQSIYLSSIIIKPFEKIVDNYYIRQAQNKISSIKRLNVIGITESYNNTNSKFLAESILKKRYKVLTTTECNNRIVELSKTINEELEYDHRVFITEIGIENIDDMEKLLWMIRPKIGVITSIESNDLKKFKNIDNIMKAKYELIEQLPADGIAIFNYDDDNIKRLADKTFKEKILYGINNIELLDVYAEDIEVLEGKSVFTIKDKEGKSIECKTKLLEKDDIYNVLGAVSIAIAMGLTLEEIKKTL